MSLTDLLAEVRSRDIELRADGERLRCDAPAGALTPELREQLRSRKSEILEFLRTAESLSRQQEAIVPLQPRGTRPPVFGFPGHNGDVFAYRDLALRLGEDQPFFALHAPGLDGRSEPCARVEDFVAYFAGQIQAFHRSGPCIVAGYCAGGPVAVELARELGRRGIEVSFVAMFGCVYPPSQRLLRQGLYWVKRTGLHLKQLARPASLAERARYLRGRLAARHRAFRAERSPDPSDALPEVMFRFKRAYEKAFFRYLPRSFSGRVCLLLPHRHWLSGADQALLWPDGALGWRAVASRVEAYYGPDSCNPDRMLLEPDAAHFAELFRQCSSTGKPLPAASAARSAAQPDSAEAGPMPEPVPSSSPTGIR